MKGSPVPEALRAGPDRVLSSAARRAPPAHLPPTAWAEEVKVGGESTTSESSRTPGRAGGVGGQVGADGHTVGARDPRPLRVGSFLRSPLPYTPSTMGIERNTKT